MSRLPGPAVIGSAPPAAYITAELGDSRTRDAGALLRPAGLIGTRTRRARPGRVTGAEWARGPRRGASPAGRT